MGNRHSPTVANLVLNDLEIKILKNNDKLLLYQRYVDDILICTEYTGITYISSKTSSTTHSRLKGNLEK